MNRSVLAARSLPATLARRHASVQASSSGSSKSPSFADQFRRSVDSAPLGTGDKLHGHVVGAFRPGSNSSRFYLVDFGLKSEAILTSRELSACTSTPASTSSSTPSTTTNNTTASSTIGEEVTLPLTALEDDFNEPSFDHSQQGQLSSLQAERTRLLTCATDVGSVVHGRVARFNRGGATVKVLGTDAFVPRHHLVVLERPVLGTFAPFYVLSLTASSNDASVDVFPVLSSYGGLVICLANAVAYGTNASEMSARERLAYLRLLTRILQQKNPAARRVIGPSSGGGRRRFHNRDNDRDYNRDQNRDNNRDYNRDYKRDHNRNNREYNMDGNRDQNRDNDSDRNRSIRDSPRKFSPQADEDDTAWLNELPKGSWASSGRIKESGKMTRPSSIHSILRGRRGSGRKGKLEKPEPTDD